MNVFDCFTCLLNEQLRVLKTNYQINKYQFEQGEYPKQKNQKEGPTNKHIDDQESLRTENKYDPYLIRDTVNTYIESLLENNEKKNYTFSNKFLDVKIVLGFLILAVILVSHYYPLPFPKNIYVLIACVTVNYYSHYESSVEGDTFALFSEYKIPRNMLRTEEVKEEKVLYRFNSSIEMLSDELSLSISYYKEKNQFIAQQKIKIYEYFDQDGYLCTVKLSKLVDKMLQNIKSKGQ